MSRQIVWLFRFGFIVADSAEVSSNSLTELDLIANWIRGTIVFD